MTVKENSIEISKSNERIARLETAIPFIKEDIGEIKNDIHKITERFVTQKKLKIAYLTGLAGLFSVLGYAIKLLAG